ncbi:cupin domain-containing protein [Natronorarus salvus]|uniref:cupin domain-containing protein n=1 Tax=Natronorarus salvus TaxID=3117733 RepID=UPI002F269F2F
MSHTKVDTADVEPVADAMHFLREPLDCENLGLTLVEAPADWTGKEHDHAEDGEEEVYLLTEGDATIVIDGETISLSPGEAVRVSPEATRQLHTEAESTFVIAGAP